MIGASLMDVKLRYVVQDVDRHGNVRTYLRRPGAMKVRLPGAPGSPEFMAAYHAAMAEVPAETVRKTKEGTFRALCIRYFSSPDFHRLDESTRAWRRRSLDAICDKLADYPAEITAKGVNALKQEWAVQPGAANNKVKALKALYAWAVEAGISDTNPMRDVKLVKYAAHGFHSWTPEDIAAFEARWPVGSKPRLAQTILLYTACRREDVVELGPQHIKDGRLRYVQAKNRDRKPVLVDIPVHRHLAEVIAATPSGHLTFLITEYGKPHSAAGFGIRFREWCNKAGLPHCSAHGLRKAAATRLAEAGASAHQIMSVTGHRSLAEVERYTQAARWSGLADDAMERVK